MAPKIGIMTFLHNSNYGSSLQAWALQQAVRELGYEVEHIDYKPSVKEKMNNLLRSGNSPRLIVEGFKKRHVGQGQKLLMEKSKSIRRFYQDFMQLSPICADHAALRSISSRYDVLIAGSDQIWSPVWLNPAYFLDFARGKPKVAYAPSLGISHIPSVRKRRILRGLLKDYQSISVREEAGAKLISRLNGSKPPVLPDPVFLIDRRQWLSLCAADSDLSNRLVCYFIGNDPSYWTRVKETAEATGLKPLVIPVTEASWGTGNEVQNKVGIQDWLASIANAGAVITDSFHGAAFAAIFHTPCRILRRWHDDSPKSKNSRIDQLMKNLSLPQNSVEQPSDFKAVDERIEQLRVQGISYLKNALQQAAAEH